MRDDMAAAFLDYATTGELTKAIARGEARRLTDPCGNYHREAISTNGSQKVTA
jgi:hypothetical protein